jgi:hypothetical protein
LLVLVLTGPGGAALVGLVGLAVMWPLRDLIDRRPRGDGRFEAPAPEAPAPEVPDRWRVWRVHEPDAAYLRRGRAA